MVQFIFTSCGSICPVLTGALAGLHNELRRHNGKGRLITITIDPEQDRPGELSRYARRHDAGSRWTFLTGTRENMAAVLESFNAWTDNKMRHRPLTFIRPEQGNLWIMLEGLTSSAELLEEYRTTTRRRK